MASKSFLVFKNPKEILKVVNLLFYFLAKFYTTHILVVISEFCYNL